MDVLAEAAPDDTSNVVNVASRMSGTRTTDAGEMFARRTAQALAATESLLSVLTPPIRVPLAPDASERYREAVLSKTKTIQGVLDAVSNAAGTHRMTLVPAATARLTSFEIVLASKLPLDLVDEWVDAEDPPAWCRRIPELMAEARANSFAAAFKRTYARSFDRTTLRAYSAGEVDRPAVVIIAPCGMPAELCEAWLRELGHTHFVVTSETRELFREGEEETTPAGDVGPQVRDIFALLDHYRISACHLMGICGGAVPALLAASEPDSRIRSVSVWHGDFELGPECPKTRPQRELQALLAMAAQGLERAQVIHEVFRSPRILAKIRRDLAHLLLYPYANASILFRYAILNGAIMRTNISTVLQDVCQPTLVVTSRDDDTAHPEGSLRVAEKLRRSRLRVEPTGDHLSVFAAPPRLTALLKSFLAEQA
jgi:pimeloyl-ACP methyl ester carboxylesterase